MEDRNRPIALLAHQRVLRMPLGWFLFQLLEFIVILSIARTFADELGIRWDLLLFVLIIAATVVNYRMRRGWLAPDEPETPTT